MVVQERPHCSDEIGPIIVCISLVDLPLEQKIDKDTEKGEESRGIPGTMIITMLTNRCSKVTTGLH